MSHASRTNPTERKTETLRDTVETFDELAGPGRAILVALCRDGSDAPLDERPARGTAGRQDDGTVET